MKTESTDDDLEWNSPLILGLTSTAVLLFVIFMVVELKVAKEPVLPVELLSRRTPIAVSLNNFFLSIVLFGTVSRYPRVLVQFSLTDWPQLYTIPLYYTAVRQMSSTVVGLRFTPMPVMGMVRSPSQLTILSFWLTLAGHVHRCRLLRQGDRQVQDAQLYFRYRRHYRRYAVLYAQA